MHARSKVLIVVMTAAVAAWASCSQDEGNGENTGSACEIVEDCYPDVNHEDLAGEVVCMDRVEDGYCTHHCSVDEDCCAVEGECDTELVQLCAPFESTGEYFCFISCEGVEDETAFCQENAHPRFICRSTGGGGDNEKVCVPEG
jgi:hypothetical protein